MRDLPSRPTGSGGMCVHVREFVHVFFGRTHESVASIVGVDALVVRSVRVLIASRAVLYAGQSSLRERVCAQSFPRSS